MNLPGPRSIISFVLLLTAALLSSYLLSSFETKEDSDDTPELGLVYYLDKATLRGTNKQGELLFSVSAAQAKRSDDNDRIELERVKLDYGPPNSLPWKVKAYDGFITPGGKYIVLRGKVVATSEREGSETITIRTPWLRVESETLIAETKEDVTLEFGDRVVYATGMEANFETNNLKLLADVNGTFLP